MKRVILHIDRLVLRGVDHADAAAVSAGLSSELARVLAPAGAESPMTAGDRRSLDAGRVRVAATTAPRVLGRVVARGIARTGAKP